MTTLQEQENEYLRLTKEAVRIGLEEDIRSLEHSKAYGYFNHGLTKQKVGALIEELKAALKDM